MVATLPQPAAPYPLLNAAVHIYILNHASGKLAQSWRILYTMDILGYFPDFSSDPA